jgi:hypothetical protein
MRLDVDRDYYVEKLILNEVFEISGSWCIHANTLILYLSFIPLFAICWFVIKVFFVFIKLWIIDYYLRSFVRVYFGYCYMDIHIISIFITKVLK